MVVTSTPGHAVLREALLKEEKRAKGSGKFGREEKANSKTPLFNFQRNTLL
jgi:hypothetical protein